MRKKQIQRINWVDRGDFPYRKPIDGDMLKAAGSIYVEPCKLANQSKTGSREIREIVYDADYVVSKISRDVFERLKPHKYEEIEWVIKAAWEHYLWEEFKGDIVNVKKEQV